MSYNGYILKISGNVFPTKYIIADTYKATPNQRTDKDDYSDADGYFHRNTLPHTRTKIEFQTPPLKMAEKDEIMDLFRNSYIHEGQRMVDIEYWDDEKSDYSSGTFYLPDIEFKYKQLKEDGIIYSGVRIALIEY